MLEADDERALYEALVTQWSEPPLLEQVDMPRFPTDGVWPAFEDVGEQMMLVDQLFTLPDDMLTKIDRATMSVSLEARVPLLDHRVAELAWRLSPGHRLDEGRGKALLRRVLARHVPPHLFEQPKTGFDPPIADWLRGPLRDWASELLDPARLRREGILEPTAIARVWSEHLSGRRNHDYRLWVVLMVESWLAGN